MSTATAIAPSLSPEQLAHFHREGYIILPSIMPHDLLEDIRQVCDAEVERKEAAMRAKSQTVEFINHLGRKYFINNTYKNHPALQRWIFSQTMAQIAQPLLGDQVQLFLEQFVVKGCDAGTTFSWHQDSGYLSFPHKEYLTCWIPLDDVNETNGTISVLPWTRAGADPRQVRPHTQDAASNDYVGYHGSDPGLAVCVPAGSVVVFSSRLLHRSGANNTQARRRAWLVQYSAEPIVSPEHKLMHQADPLLIDGHLVSRS